MTRNIPFLLIVIALAAPFVLPGTYYIYLAELVVIYAIAALGVRQFLATTNQLVFCQSAMMAIGAYSFALTARQFGDGITGLFIGLVAGLIISGAVSMALIFPALRLRGPYFAMITIAFGWIVWRTAIEWTAVTGGDLGISAIPNFAAALGLPPSAQYVASLAVLAAVSGILWRIGNSAFGVLQLAHSVDTMALAALGVRVDHIRLIAFVAGSCIGALAGAFFAMHQAYINPNGFEVFDSVSLLVAVLIGGVSRQVGTVIGVIAIYIAPEFLHALDAYRLLFYGALVLLMLNFAREGLLRDNRSQIWRRPFHGTGAVGGLVSWLEELHPGPRHTHLKISGVQKHFGTIRALGGVDLDVRAGEVHGVVGPNGSGKSTLLDVASGLVPRDGGSVTLNDLKLPREGVDRIARYDMLRTFQKIRNFDTLTCRENVLAGIVAQRFRTSTFGIFRAMANRVATRDEERAQAILGSLGLAAHSDDLAAALPQGRRRALEIARILAAGPRVLLLDEPTSGLSRDERDEIARAILLCRDHGIAVILVDHDMELIEHLCDQVTALSVGRVIAQGSPQAVLADERFKADYFGGGERDVDA